MIWPGLFLQAGVEGLLIFFFFPDTAHAFNMLSNPSPVVQNSLTSNAMASVRFNVGLSCLF